MSNYEVAPFRSAKYISLISHLPNLILENRNINWRDALSEEQLSSKCWLIETLIDLGLTELKSTLILGGWVGILGYLMLSDSRLKVAFIRSLDIDTEVERVADTINLEYVGDNWKFKAGIADWNKIEYGATEYLVHKYSDKTEQRELTQFSTIVNTCCEHVEKFESWIRKLPSDRLLILQSNSNASYVGHVNSQPTLEAFRDSCGLSKTLFAGSLETKYYTRWMVVGYR
jgi:hypothetical protein